MGSGVTLHAAWKATYIIISQSLSLEHAVEDTFLLMNQILPHKLASCPDFLLPCNLCLNTSIALYDVFASLPHKENELLSFPLCEVSHS